MHELSIAEELMRVIRDEMKPHAEARLKQATVRIGALRLIEPASLQCCFEAATRDTSLAGARLHIEPVAAQAECPQCHAKFPVQHNWFECPDCGTIGAKVVAGNELHLVGLELETTPKPTGAARPLGKPIEGNYADQT